MAFDDRLGFSVHFDQNQSVSANMPIIAASGVQWIRDDFNHGLTEPSFGVYNVNGMKPFWAAAKALGLKTCAIIRSGGLQYNNVGLDAYDPTALSNYCAAMATSPNIDAFEIVNEPNNVTQFTGTAGFQTLVTLTTACTAAIHSVNPATPVIGLGSQGNQILAMLALGPVMDGLVYHPYDPGDNIPEHVFEPSFTNYLTWVAAVRAATSLPIWETERNLSGGSEYVGAVWNARRIILSLGIGIEHSFIYDFQDSNSQGCFDLNLNPRQMYIVLQRIIKYLSPLTSNGAVQTIIPGSTDFDVADSYSYLFSSASTTVAAVWIGNFKATAPPKPGTATISFPVANSVTANAKVVDVVKGIELPLTSWSFSNTGGILSVFNFIVDDRPRLIIAQ